MSEKYKITAKPGDRRVYKPKLEGKEWTEHPLYGESCTVIDSGNVYDVHLIHVDGTGKPWLLGKRLG